MVNGICEGKRCNIMLDSGSSVSLISSAFVNHLHLDQKISPSSVKLISFSNDNIPVQGELRLNLGIAGQTSNHDFVVTDRLLETEFLLGIDFMQQHEITLNLGRRELITRWGFCQITDIPTPVKRSMKIRCQKTVQIPPNSMMYITGSLEAGNHNHGWRDYTNYSGIVEPYNNTMLKTNTIFANAIVHSENRKLPLQVINATDEPITLYRNKLLAFLCPIDTGNDLHTVNATYSSGNLTGNTDNFNTKHVTGVTWDKNDLFNQLKIKDIKIPTDEKEILKDIIWHYRDIFSMGDHDIGCCNFYEADIVLKPDHVPVWTPSRPIPYKLRPHMDEHIKNMLSAGVIEPCKEPSAWNSPIMLVQKSTPGKYRPVVDLRNLNKNCIGDRYQLANINHALDKLGGNCLYSTCDLSSSFHQVKYKKEVRQCTAFLYDDTQYIFNRMIMGHVSSSSQFTRMMNKLLAGIPIPHLTYFLDDLLVASNSIGKHLQYLEIIFERFLQGNLKISPSKCQLLRDEVVYIGLTINKDGVRVNKDRIAALIELKPPTNTKEVQKILGFFGYNRRWVPQYAEITRPLYNLLTKGKTFEWNGVCQSSFERLKAVLAENITLHFPDVEDPLSSYEVTIDGSNLGGGAILTQVVKGERRIIAFMSKTWPKHKREWGQTRIEFETLYQSIKNWAIFLRGCSFVLKTDCLSLLHLDTIFSKTNATVHRKLQFLADFDFTIEHISGKSNTTADFLSRYPHKSTFVEQGTQTEMQNFNSKGAGAIHLIGGIPKHDIPIIFGGPKNVRPDGQVANPGPKPLIRPDNNIETEGIPKHDIPIIFGGPKNVRPDGRVTNPDYKTLIRPDINSNTNDIPNHDIPVNLDGPGNIRLDGQMIDPDYLSNIDINDHTDDLEIPESLYSLEGDFPVSFVTVKSQAFSTCLCGDEQAILAKNRHTVCSILGQENLSTDKVILPELSDLRKAQEQDEILKTVRQWIEKGEKPKLIQATRVPHELLSYWKQFSLLKLDNGLIKRKWVSLSKKNYDIDRDLIVVPDSWQEQIIRLHHDTTTHPGVALTLELCRRWCYWAGMEEEIRMLVGSCITCGQSKHPQAYLKAPLQHIVCCNLNDLIEIDHIVPTAERKTPRGFRYILTITDVWSGYIIAIPVKSQTAEENVRAVLHKWVLKYGCPKTMLCDNHPGYRARLFEAIMQAFDCAVKHGISYKSRTTGKVERQNRRLNAALRAVIPEGSENNWDLYLDYVTFALNSLRSRHTGYSANRLVFGRELNTPLSLIVDNENSSVNPDKSQYHKRAYIQHKELKTIIKKVRENAETDFMYSQRFHDKNLHGPYFKKGEKCYIFTECPSHKFSKRWRGPYTVNKAISDHVYVVQLPDGEKVCNIQKMKHYNISKFSPVEHTRTLPQVPKSEGVSVETQRPRRRSESDDEVIVEVRQAPTTVDVTPILPTTATSRLSENATPFTPVYLPRIPVTVTKYTPVINTPVADEILPTIETVLTPAGQNDVVPDVDDEADAIIQTPLGVTGDFSDSEELQGTSSTGGRLRPSRVRKAPDWFQAGYS